MPAALDPPADALLASATLKGLGDKLYDRRKAAALEVEQLIKHLAREEEWQRVERILEQLTENYAYSPQANCRKGGLLALAAAAVAITERKLDFKRRGEPFAGPDYLGLVVPPVLNSLVDADAHVRYYACEALYNIAKVAREDFLEPHFTPTFDAIFRLVADPDPHVHQATTFLDSLMKDIVTAHEHFHMDAFMQQFERALEVTSPRKRAFLLSWMQEREQVLAGVPDLDLLAVLPQFLGRLLDCLTDPWMEVRTQATKVLRDLLVDIQASQHVDYAALTRILAGAARRGEAAQRLTALRWLCAFLADARRDLLPQYPELVAVVLPALAHPDAAIRDAAHEANELLVALPPGWQAKARPGDLLMALAAQVSSPAESARLAALAWLAALLARDRAVVSVTLAMVLSHLAAIAPALLEALNAGSERVVVEALAVQAAIATDHPAHFRALMHKLLDRFRGAAGARLLQRRGALVVRRVTGALGGRAVFGALAAELAVERDARFAAALAQALNLILLTAPEAQELRDLLQCSASNPEGAQFFETLYRAWAHSTGALLSLCFLSEAYEHAAELINCFASIPVGVEALVQLDRLVQLLESPAFARLRLHLLNPLMHPALVRALYGIQALLPQSDAWKMLHARLHSMPTTTLLHLAAFVQGPSAPAQAAAMLQAFGIGRASDNSQQSTSEKAVVGERGAGSPVHIPYAELRELFMERQRAAAREEDQQAATAAASSVGNQETAEDAQMKGSTSGEETSNAVGSFGLGQ